MNDKRLRSLTSTSVLFVTDDLEQKAVRFGTWLHLDRNVQTFGQLSLVDTKGQMNGMHMKHQLHRQTFLEENLDCTNTILRVKLK